MADPIKALGILGKADNPLKKILLDEYETILSGAVAKAADLGVFQSKIVTGATEGSEDVTVGDGTGAKVGQLKLITLVTRSHASDVVNLDHANMVDADGVTPLQNMDLDAANEYVLLKWNGVKWQAVATNGTKTAYEDFVSLVAAQGTLTLDTNPTDADTMTVGDVVYRFKDTMAQANDVQIGAAVADTQANVVAAINGTGTDGVEYYAGTVVNPKASIAAFASDDAVLTARQAGTPGNAYATTETFTAETNVFDAATLGTTTAGAAPDATLTVFESKITTAGAGASEDFNVGDGTGVRVGTRKLVTLAVRSDASDVVNLDHANCVNASGTQLTNLDLDAADEFVLLEWNGSKWQIVYANATEATA